MLLACSTCMAQRLISFFPIALSYSGATATGGTPIIINGKCLTVAGGLFALTITTNNKGNYGAVCMMANVTNVSVSLKLYPTNHPATLKCEDQFDADLSCQVRIMRIEGRIMMSQMVLIKEVQAGYI